MPLSWAKPVQSAATGQLRITRVAPLWSAGADIQERPPSLVATTVSPVIMKQSLPVAQLIPVPAACCGDL
jgi:hypothetical protein